MNVALDVVPGNCGDGIQLDEVVFEGGERLSSGGLFFAPINFGGAALIPIAPSGRNPASR